MIKYGTPIQIGYWSQEKRHHMKFNAIYRGMNEQTGEILYTVKDTPKKCKCNDFDFWLCDCKEI